MSLPELATTTSSFPSLLTSLSATDDGLAPAAKLEGPLKLGASPGIGPLLSSTETPFGPVAPPLATTMSSIRSPLRSPSATAEGWAPAPKFTGEAKLGRSSAADVVFRSTETPSVPSALPEFAVTTSSRPPPVRSPSATDAGLAPAVKLSGAVKLGVAPADAAPSSAAAIAASVMIEKIRLRLMFDLRADRANTRGGVDQTLSSKRTPTN